MRIYLSQLRSIKFSIILILLYSNQLLSQTQTPANTEIQEVYLNFSYSLGLVNSIVTAIYVEPKVYLPVSEIFRLLKINYTFDKNSGTITGFYIDQKRKYEMNFRMRRAFVDTTHFHIESEEFYFYTLDAYITPSVFERLFRLRFRIDLSHLTLSLETEEELPIIAEKKREQRQKMLENQTATPIDYPLLFPRNKYLLNGGFLDYSLTTATTKKYNSYGYDIRSGSIVAGGDLELSANGYYKTLATSNMSMEGRWRYVIDNTPYISNVNVGYVNASGLYSRSIKGIQVSNEPVQIRTMYRTYVIEQRTNPNWIVELYLNETLTAVTQADALGNFRFVIPLTYGTTNYYLRSYGPTGEIVEDKQRIQIPFSFVPSGEINYTISAGALRENNYRYSQTSVTTGLTSWLTSRVHIEYINDTISSKPISSVSLFSWLKNNYILSLDIAPNALYRAELTAIYASHASASISFTKHSQNLFYNPSNALSDIQTSFSIPLFLKSTPSIYRLQANRRNYRNGATTFLTTGATSTYKQFNGTIEYRYSELKSNIFMTMREPQLLMSFLYSISPLKKLAHITPSILLGSSFIYNLERKKAAELRLDLSSNITPAGRLQLSFGKDFIREQTTASLQFIYEFSYMRSTSTITKERNSLLAIQNVRGSIGYDSKLKTYYSYNLDAVGHSALTMRMFVDKNNNTVFDNGEQIIDDVAFNLEQTAFIDFDESGISRARRLLPYTLYNINIIESSISNPLWMPTTQVFSVVTEPNVYKLIDMPFYASGVLDGTVLMQIGNKIDAVPGIELHIKSIDNKYHKNIRVFADGSFYQMGIPPGKYIAYVDSMQLNILGVISDPPINSFEVKFTSDGDYIEGMNFLLKKQIDDKPISSQIDDSISEIDSISQKDTKLEVARNNEEKYQIKTAKPKGYVIHISTWDTQRKAREEAKKFEREMQVKTSVEKIVSNGKVKYAVHIGVYSTKEEAYLVLRSLP